MTIPPLDELIARATLWAERQSSQIMSLGAPLDQLTCALARRVGVRSPENVRVLVVPAVPFPEDPVLKQLSSETKLITEDTGGMTLFYGVYIRRDRQGEKTIWAHECRHVAQYECCGSIHSFLSVYIRELFFFGYGSGPFEVDAQVAESNA